MSVPPRLIPTYTLLSPRITAKFRSCETWFLCRYAARGSRLPGATHNDIPTAGFEMFHAIRLYLAANIWYHRAFPTTDGRRLR